MLVALIRPASSLRPNAAAPQLRTQAPGFYRTMLGDFEITALSDGTVDLDVAKLLAEPAAETDAALRARPSSTARSRPRSTPTWSTPARSWCWSTPAPARCSARRWASCSPTCRRPATSPSRSTTSSSRTCTPTTSAACRPTASACSPTRRCTPTSATPTSGCRRPSSTRRPTAMKGFFQGAMALGQPVRRGRQVPAVRGRRRAVPGIRARRRAGPHGGPHVATWSRARASGCWSSAT